MSYIKFSTNLFLEKIEYNRFKKFIDDAGFRKALLANSVRFGLIDKQYFLQDPLNVNTILNEFNNGLITEGSNLTLDYNDILAINSAGNFISFDAGNIEVLADNNWYWVKIRHQFISKEKGTLSIDANGNLTGTDTKFLEVLRGQPNFPARIKFVNSLNNVQEYDVLEVIDDTNAILENAPFVAETDLEYIVIGTFTPGSVPLSTEKEIFQYDSCLMTLEQETTLNTRPVYVDGTDFFLARVKNDGTTLVIQDKRIDLWKPKADFKLFNITQREAVNFGIEKIKFNDSSSTLDKNVVYVSWTFRSVNYTVNSNLNIVSILGGEGGKYKSVNDFVNDDFDGYRIYTKDGKYSIIKDSVRVGNQINCYLDQLDIDRYSDDGGLTFHFNEIVIAPDAEEIEIICNATGIEDSGSLSHGEPLVVNQRKVFPINLGYGTIELFVYENPKAKYDISYRFKHVDVYSREYYPVTGSNQDYHYNENAFDASGDFLPLVLLNSLAQNIAQGYISVYVDNSFELILHQAAYSNFFVGDKIGVDNVTLSNANPIINLLPGADRQYQYYTGIAVNLSADMFICLQKVTAFGTNLKNGSVFWIHVKQHVFNLANFKLRIVQDFVNATNYSLLKEFDISDERFLQNSDEGIFLRCSYDGNNWIINAVNEVRTIIDRDPVNFGSSWNTTLVTASQLLRSYTPTDVLSGNILVILDGYLSPPSGAFQSSDLSIQVAGIGYATKTITTNNVGGSYPFTLVAVIPYIAGQTIEIHGATSSNIVGVVAHTTITGNTLNKG